MAKSKRDSVTVGPKTTGLAQGYADAAARGGGIQPGANAKEADRGVKLGNPIEQVGSMVRAAGRFFSGSPKPIGNSSRDAHNARAAAFDADAAAKSAAADRQRVREQMARNAEMDRQAEADRKARDAAVKARR